MKENVKRVFYVRQVAHPCYLDLMAQRPEIRIDKLENETPDEAVQPIITAAHAYQIGSARDELRPRFHAQRDLLARMPNLLVVSTSGAGYDTVDVKDCTEAGVLVVNQTGGNAEAVAAHVVAMMLMLSKQIIQTNHALRRGTMRDRAAFMGNDVQGRTIGIVGLGNVGSATLNILAENADQAVCADLLREAIVRAEKDGIEVIGHVHDEIITEASPSRAKAQGTKLQRCMLTVPKWAAGLPLKVETDISPRFRK